MRATSAITSTAAAIATFTGLATAFSATSKTNVVTYWGQGPNQGSLQDVCKNPNVDIVNIGFVNVFPDQGAAGWPGTNFGNACGSETYTHNGTSTQLYSNCPQIGPDIAICQQIYGKKVFLSLGGGYPTNYFIANSTSAVNFAKFLWGAFGPSTDAWTSAGGPRPFGDAVVDGFDFDIESDLAAAPVSNGKTITDYKTRGYADMITYFRSSLFTKDTSKSYYISGAPQCVVPDAHFATVVSAAWFDFLFIQYYNTASCSARQAITSGSFTGYTNWAAVKSNNTNVKLYVGLPANTNASIDASYYLKPSEVKTIVGEVYSNSRFGGIMVWEATYAANNVICNKDYITWMKQILNAQADGTTINTTTSPCPAQPISKDGTCGQYNGYTCTGSIFGSCCSVYGYCGSSADYCNTATCDPKGGNCGLKYVSSSSSKKVSSTSSTKAPTSSVKVTSSSKKTSSTAVVKVVSSSSKKTSSTSSKKVTSTSSSKKVTSSSSKKVTSSSSTKKTTSSAKASVSVKARFQLNNNNSTAAAAGTGVVAAAAADNAAGTAAGSVVASTAGSAVASGNAAPSGAFPSMVAPYSNSSNSFGAGANGNFQAVTSTVYSTSTVYQTLVQTITTTDAQGAQSTEYVTKTVSVYTTIYPVSTVVSKPGSGSSSNSGSSNSGSSDTSEGDKTGNSFVADTLAQVSQNAGYTAVTKTIYTTATVTATIRQKTVTLTTTYPLTTTVEYVPAASGYGAGLANSMSTRTTTIKTTVTNTETVFTAASAAPFAFTNGTGNALYAPSGTVTVNAAAAALNSAASGSVSASIDVAASASPIVVYKTQVIVPVAVAQSSSATAASASASAVSNSRIYGAAAVPANETSYSSSYEMEAKNAAVAYEMKKAYTGAGSEVKVELGVCALALLVGVFFAM